MRTFFQQEIIGLLILYVKSVMLDYVEPKCVVSAPFPTEASKMCGWKGKKTLLKQLETHAIHVSRGSI